MNKSINAVLKPSSKSKIEELESIRGIAAFEVFYGHIPAWNPILHNADNIGAAASMVDLFFVLSGFVIYTAYAEKLTSLKEVFRFQFLRFGRLYPVHLIFLFFFLAVEIIKYVLQVKYGVSAPNNQAFTDSGWQAFFENLLLIQVLSFDGNQLSFNGPSWSISVEFYMYLLFGFIVRYLGKLKIFIFALIPIISILVLANLSVDNTQHLSYVFIFRCLAGFSIGCCTAYAANILNYKISSVYVTLTVACMLIFYVFKGDGAENGVLFFLLCSLLIFSIVSSEEGVIKRILRLNILTWFGTISYTLYMSHMAMIWIVNQFLRFVLKKPENVINGFSTPDLSVNESLIAAIVLILMVLIVSHLTYSFVEHPLRMKSRKIAAGF
ncbi:acyltransferase [Methylomonas sp. AM2-LC]|uniref:acyltransferase family protein n=1 Tax=Methylomonas sp. AM2-LC TaxID=3153301 RepID=UPI0032644A47